MTNNLIKIIREAEEEWDANFDSRFYGRPKLLSLDPDKLRDFSRTSTLKLLEGVKEMIEKDGLIALLPLTEAITTLKEEK